MARITLRDAAQWCGGTVEEKYADLVFSASAHLWREMPSIRATPSTVRALYTVKYPGMGRLTCSRSSPQTAVKEIPSACSSTLSA